IARAEPLMEHNSFINDIVGRLKRGQVSVLSDKQLRAVEKVVDMWRLPGDVVKGDAPQGVQTVEGVILTVKDQQSQFGVQTKMLLELENHSTVWGTCGKALFGLVPPVECGDYEEGLKRRFRGVRVRFEANFERSGDDSTLGFFKRPKGFVVVSY
ncbi:MAG: hypothetical protein FWG43_06020, partial [Clostridiales bacterium]|nr:hypothetical protein [Clostridiales bacterium]